MSLSGEQLQEWFRSEAKFPPRFPDLAKVEVQDLSLQSNQQCGIPAADPPDGSAQAPPAPAKEPVMVVTEVSDRVQRFIRLPDVQSVFMPSTTEKKKIDLEHGMWLTHFGTSTTKEANDRIRAAAAQLPDNSMGLAIVFVAGAARMLNVTSFAATAAESAGLTAPSPKRCCFTPPEAFGGCC